MPADAIRAALSRALLPALVLLHAGLLLWAIVGLIEWFAPAVPWPELSNPLFPRWLLLMHWSAILIAAMVFLIGCAGRWPATPMAMIPAYAFMAVVCVIETFWFLQHPWRHLALVLELAAYVAIPIALQRLPALARRFRTGKAG